MFVLLAMVGCSTIKNSSNSASSKAQPSLLNTQWRLEDSVKGKTPTLVIENEKLSGNAGCNNYFGTITLDASNGSFAAKNIGSTRMACPNMQAEANFLKMLNEANRYVSKNGTLELYKDQLLLMKLTQMGK